MNNSFSSHWVVDQLARDLDERRRTTIGRRAAYLALANTIVGNEPTLKRGAPREFSLTSRLDLTSRLERQLSAIGRRSSSAA
jgi:hypothetical protein